MTVESATYISDLNTANPGSTDLKAEGDDHLRLLKSTVKATFPNVTGAVTGTHTALNNAAAGTFSGAVSAVGSITAPNFYVGSLTSSSGTYGVSGSNGGQMLAWGNASAGAGRIEFYTGSLKKVQIGTTALTVNYLTLDGSPTLNNVSITADGTDSNVGINYLAKGTSGHAFYGQTSTPQFAISSTASSTRYLVATGSAAGNPTLSASAGSIAFGSAISTTGDSDGVGMVRSRSKASTTARNSTTTLADDPHLIIPLSVGTWSVDLLLFIFGASTGAGGFKYTLTFSGTQTSNAFAGGYSVANSALASAGSSFGISTVGFATSPIRAGSIPNSSDYVQAGGTITVSVAGNLTVQWAQNTSNADNTSLAQGSYVNCTRVA